MNDLQGKVLTLPKMSGSASSPGPLSGNTGAKTINIGGKGEDGATFIPSVANGILSWTNDRDLPNPAPVNIKGDKGDRGLQGVQGIQGEKGDKGDKGDRGEQGIQGVKGDKGDTGAPGKDGADGQPGKDGTDGKTPIKGVDYFTATDKNEMVQAVISALPVYNGEVITV